MRQVRQTDEDSEASASASGSEDFFESEGDEESVPPGDISQGDADSASEAVPDVDSARVAQWVDDEELEDSEAETESESSVCEEEPQHVVREEWQSIFASL